VDIIEADSFYFTLPLEGQYKVMYQLENYITPGINVKVKTIDFNCAVVINPTYEQLDKLKEILGPDFNENLKINERHSDAVRCIIESKGIPIIVPTGQFVRFIGKNRTWDLDIRRDTFPDWKFILFNERMEPVVLPTVMVTMEEVEKYFGIEE